MKKILSLLILVLIPLTCFAQLKSQVCVVKEVFPEKTIEDMKTFADELSKNGSKDMSEAVKKFIDGGSFGSGFVFVTPDGTNYIITNRHVVEQARTLNVEFYNDDGSVTKYEGLTIVSLDKDLDLALLAFPAGTKPFTSGLRLYDGPLNDGDLVFTAGFPGFFGKPSWQLGTGNVSNSKVIIEELVNPEITTLIQHSAQVDPGNSGGPLLRRTKSGEYVVIGINTWKVMNRQAANFSIPIAAVKDFISKSLSGETVDSVEEVSKRAREFEKIIADWDAKYQDIVPFIAVDFVADYGMDIFLDVAKRASKDAWDSILSVFYNESPIAGMRYAIAWYIFYEYHKGEKSSTKKGEEESEIILPGFETPEKQNGSEKYDVVYNLPNSKNIVKSVWSNEYGIWKLYSFTNDKASKKSDKKKTEKPSVKKSEKNVSKANKPKKNTILTSPYGVAISTGVFIDLDNGFSFSIPVYINPEIVFANYYAIDIKFMADYWWLNTEDGFPFRTFSIVGGPKFQLPLNFSNTAFVFYAGVDAGVYVDSYDADNMKPSFLSTYYGGLKLLFKNDTPVSYFLDCGVRIDGYLIMEKGKNKYILDQYMPYCGIGLSF